MKLLDEGELSQSCRVDGIRERAAPSGKGMVSPTEGSLGKEGWLREGPTEGFPGQRRERAETVRPVRDLLRPRAISERDAKTGEWGREWAAEPRDKRDGDLGRERQRWTNRDKERNRAGTQRPAQSERGGK